LNYRPIQAATSQSPEPLAVILKDNSQMKYLIQFLIIITIVSCHKDDKKIKPKNYFSISENKAKQDSVIKNLEKDSTKELPPLPRIDKKLNLDYQLGAIHFMILDTITSYYYVNKLESDFMMCGNDFIPFNKKDSLNYIKRNIDKIPSAKKIKTTEIPKILNLYSREIVLNPSLPLIISFSSKNDTIKGNTMKNIFSFMENKGMNRYFIRRFNDAEIKADFK